MKREGKRKQNSVALVKKRNLTIFFFDEFERDTKKQQQKMVADEVEKLHWSWNFSHDRKWSYGFFFQEKSGFFFFFI